MTEGGCAMTGDVVPLFVGSAKQPTEWEKTEHLKCVRGLVQARQSQWRSARRHWELKASYCTEHLQSFVDGI